QVDVLQRVEGTVIEVEIADGKLGFLGDRQFDLGVHDWLSVASYFSLRKNTRAAMFRPSTPSVIRNTPAQAMRCRFGYGCMAKLLIVTGTLIMSLPMLPLKNWLLAAVYSSGAVSPAMRATA